MLDRTVRADSGLDAPKRMQALADTGLLDSGAEPAFDRVTRLASQLLAVPICLTTLVDSDRQFFKSAVGLSEPWLSERQTPLSHSFCKHVVLSGKSLIINDAREDNLVAENLAIKELGVIAYLGVPLTTASGHVLGALCAIDHEPRNWTLTDVDNLAEFGAIVMDEIVLRGELAKRSAIQGHQKVLIEDLTDRVESLNEAVLHFTA